MAAETLFAERVGDREIGARGAAAVVADAVEAQSRRIQLRLAFVLLQPRDAHSRAVGAFPDEQWREARFRDRRPGDHVGGESCLDEHTRKPGGVAEGVGGEADRAPPAGELLEHLLAELALAPHRVGGGAEQVGLDPPSAHRLPASRLHETADAIEQRRVVGGQPPVHHGLAHHERRSRVRFEQVDGGASGVERLDARFARAPDPGEIEMRVPGERRDATRRVGGRRVGGLGDVRCGLVGHAGCRSIMGGIRSNPVPEMPTPKSSRAAGIAVTCPARGTLFLAGNGGSFADALHVAGELAKNSNATAGSPTACAPG